MGPVTPLIAVYQTLKSREAQAEFCWFGTPNGPEKPVILAHSIPFYAISVAKFPRYPSKQWLTWPFDLYRAYSEAKKYLKNERPSIVIGAGGFTAFPVSLAARSLKIPVFLHQLDVHPSLTNKLIAPFASRITTSFSYKKSPFFTKASIHTIATPVRDMGEEMSKEVAATYFALDATRPTVLIIGGGTGAQAINDAFLQKKDTWFKDMQVIHVAGKGKKADDSSYEFLDAESMLAAYTLADVVVTRAGMGSLSEIVSLQKPSVIVPIPSSQQEANAQVFADADAAIVLHQQDEGFASLLHACVLALIQQPKDAKMLTDQYSKVMKADHGEAFVQQLETFLQ